LQAPAWDFRFQKEQEQTRVGFLMQRPGAAGLVLMQMPLES
jgi:hypothetical protein